MSWTEEKVAKLKGRDLFTGWQQNDLPEFLLFLIDSFHIAMQREVEMNIKGNALNDRDKLAKSVFIALKKRPIDTETTEKFISRISRSLEELGQSEISTNTIGTMVMEGLKELDPVAYVRFA